MPSSSPDSDVDEVEVGVDEVEVAHNFRPSNVCGVELRLNNLHWFYLCHKIGQSICRHDCIARLIIFLFTLLLTPELGSLC